MLVTACQSISGKSLAPYEPVASNEFVQFVLPTATPNTSIIYEPLTVPINREKPKIKQVDVKPKVELKYKPEQVRVPKSAAKQFALSIVGPVQFVCLNKLWNRESGWNYKAHNKSSGAYGIPQAVPGSKMASAGADWRTNPITQVKWGLKYIKGRYGSSCNAWRFFLNHGWY